MNEQKINKNLLQDKLFDVCTMSDHIMTVFADNLEVAEELYCNSENIVVGSCLHESGDITIKELRQMINDAGVELHDILRTPQDLLQQIIGEDYIIQPVFSDKHYTEFIVIDGGVEFSFQINNKYYNVFNVTTSGTFFANNHCVQHWHKFLLVCEEIFGFIYDYYNA